MGRPHIEATGGAAPGPAPWRRPGPGAPLGPGLALALAVASAAAARAEERAPAETPEEAFAATVRGEAEPEAPVRLRLPGEEVRRVPGARGDALGAVLNLPSVGRSPFDAGQLIVRGSPPGATAAFLGGLPVPQPFHATLGVEARPLRRLRALAAMTLEANVFYKDLRHLAVSSRAAVSREGRAVPEVYSDLGEGRVYGADLLLTHRGGRFVYGLLAYTVMRSERRDGPAGPLRPFRFDQTHVLTLIAGCHLPWGIDVGLRLRYATGNPDTELLGARAYDADADAYAPRGAAPGGARLPDFVQLDLRIDKRFQFRRWSLSLYLDAYNATSRANVEGWTYSYDFAQRTPVAGLPIIPSFGLRGSL